MLHALSGLQPFCDALTAGTKRHKILLTMIVPVFPLPNVVLFPKTLLPLHIFEDRYRTMTREALAGDGRIVIALLREGWEKDYRDSPAVHKVACLGKIETYEELEGGRYNIVLIGIRRVRLVREVQQAPYRRAEVEPLVECCSDEGAAVVAARRNRLGALFTRFTELMTDGQYRAGDLVPQLDFEGLVNVVASTLNLPADDKQALLEIDDIVKRCDSLIPLLQRQLESLVIVRQFEHIKPEDPNRN
jgi:Lon protease-like protein